MKKFYKLPKIIISDDRTVFTDTSPICYEIEIVDCPNLTEIKDIGRRFSNIYISNCLKLERIDDLHCYNLAISNCPNLTEIVDIETSDLKITSSPNLNSIIDSSFNYAYLENCVISEIGTNRDCFILHLKNCKNICEIPKKIGHLILDNDKLSSEIQFLPETVKIRELTLINVNVKEVRYLGLDSIRLVNSTNLIKILSNKPYRLSAEGDCCKFIGFDKWKSEYL